MYTYNTPGDLKKKKNFIDIIFNRLIFQIKIIFSGLVVRYAGSGKTDSDLPKVQESRWDHES